MRLLQEIDVELLNVDVRICPRHVVVKTTVSTVLKCEKDHEKVTNCIARMTHFNKKSRGNHVWAVKKYPIFKPTLASQTTNFQRQKLLMLKSA
jgi:hypothetical protein